MIFIGWKKDSFRSGWIIRVIFCAVVLLSLAGCSMNSGIRNLVFVIGGAFGFAPSVYAAAHDKISLSQMTFNHQMVRLFFVEQLYRAFTILRHEPYHNE